MFIMHSVYLYKIFIAIYILIFVSMYIAINILYKYAPDTINISYVYILYLLHINL